MDHEHKLRCLMEHAEDIVKIATELGSMSRPATAYDLKRLERKIDAMATAIADFATKVNAHQDKIDNAVSGLTSDVDEMKKLIEKLQSNPGPISPEDQQLLDQLEARTGSVVQKLEALDALTPPPAPPA